MNQAVLMDADVHKGAEGSDIGDHAFQRHTLLDVFNLRHVIPEGRLFKGCARITSGLLQFRNDIPKRRFADRLRHIVRDLNLFDLIRVADQLGEFHAQIFGHLFHECVALRMDRGGIQRMFRIPDAQEARGLLKSLRPHARDLAQLLATAEGAMLIAIADDLLGHRGANA